MRARKSWPSESGNRYGRASRRPGERRTRNSAGQILFRYPTHLHKLRTACSLDKSFVRRTLASTVPDIASPEKHRAPIGRGKGHEPKVTKSAQETCAQVLPKGRAGETSG